MTYKELYDNVENVWSILFATGYLTHWGEPEGNRERLVIPNREIHNIFMNQIREKRYTRQPYLDGMKKIITCGIACHGKDCRIVFEAEEQPCQSIEGEQ